MGFLRILKLEKNASVRCFTKKQQVIEASFKKIYEEEVALCDEFDRAHREQWDRELLTSMSMSKGDCQNRTSENCERGGSDRIFKQGPERCRLYLNEDQEETKCGPNRKEIIETMWQHVNQGTPFTLKIQPIVLMLRDLVRDLQLSDLLYVPHRTYHELVVMYVALHLASECASMKEDAQRLEAFYNALQTGWIQEAGPLPICGWFLVLPYCLDHPKSPSQQPSQPPTEKPVMSNSTSLVSAAATMLLGSLLMATGVAAERETNYASGSVSAPRHELSPLQSFPGKIEYEQLITPSAEWSTMDRVRKQLQAKDASDLQFFDTRKDYVYKTGSERLNLVLDRLIAQTYRNTKLLESYDSWAMLHRKHTGFLDAETEQNLYLAIYQSVRILAYWQKEAMHQDSLILGGYLQLVPEEPHAALIPFMRFFASFHHALMDGDKDFQIVNPGETLRMLNGFLNYVVPLMKLDAVQWKESWWEHMLRLRQLFGDLLLTWSERKKTYLLAGVFTSMVGISSYAMWKCVRRLRR